MDRLRQLIAVTLIVSGIAIADEPARYEFEAGGDISYIDTSGYASWAQGSAGKLRHDGDTNGLQFSRAFAAYKLRVTDTVNATIAVDIYDDDLGSSADFTQAFVEWRPLTMTANRYRLKLGAFYPRISLENTNVDWSTPYTITPSVLNTWVGEELRVFGAEASVSRRPLSLGGVHTFSLHAAVYYNNDPAGTLLSWRGWSLHDRQTRFGDELPLPPVPRIQPGNWFDAQDPFVAPFKETDDRAGYYINGEWVINNRFLLRVMHYDNRADPQSYEDGQFGWRTSFYHVGVQASLPGDALLIAQWMDGTTVWGFETNGVYTVDVELLSYFVLLTKTVGEHRFSLRYDRFELTENDQIPLDRNSEDGHAWTFAYQFQFSRRAAFAVEWLEIKTFREAWAYYGLNQSNTENQLQLSLRLRFGNPH